MKRKLRHASTFSGIGGPEVAAAMLGWENVFHCEINPFGRRVLEYWFPNSDSHEDVTKTDFRRYRGRIDVLTAGFPCQPFSFAGKRRGAADDRYLWPEMLRVIDEVRPTWVVGENVAGIATVVEPGEVADMGCEASLFCEGDGVHRYTGRDRFTIERICSDLERAGYSVQPVLVPAAAVGAPHRRDRIFFLAHTEDPLGDGCGREPGDGEAEAEAGGQRMPFAGDSERVGHETGTASDTEGNRDNRRPGTVLREERGQAQLDAEHIVNGSIRASAHPDEHGHTPCGKGDKGLQGIGLRKINEKKGREDAKRCPVQSAYDDWGTPFTDRWRDFPTVPPVHRGDDGFRIHVDNKTIYGGEYRMDRDSVISGALSTGKLEVDFATGEIYSTRIRGHEGERIKLKGSVCNGYIIHTLSFNGIKKQCRAHQIVWIAANGLYDKGKWQIDHINRVRTDNRIQNLRLVTAKENIANSEHYHHSKLSEQDKQHIYHAYINGNATAGELAEDYGVSKSCIYQLLNKMPQITIPFPRWREESLKAYGNAIVPQVIYEIFRGIDETDNNG